MRIVKSLSQFSIERRVHYSLKYLIKDDGVETLSDFPDDELSGKCVHLKTSNSKEFKNDATIQESSTDVNNPVFRIKYILNILPKTLHLDFIGSLKEILETNLPYQNVRKKFDHRYTAFMY